MTWTAADCKFATIWLQFEFLVSVTFLAFITICLMIGKHFTKKSLRGSTVVITNGESKLSQEISRQMTVLHKCRVILVMSNQPPKMDSDNESSGHQYMYQCNVLENADIRNLTELIKTDLGTETIDILIENGKPITSHAENYSKENCIQFIESTSRSIMSTINLLINFIPKLMQSNRGHFVTIQPSHQTARAFLDSKSEIRELISHLSVNRESSHGSNIYGDDANSVLADRQPFNASHPYQHPLRLSTIIFKNKTASDSKLLNIFDLSLCEIAESIIAGIQSEKRIIEITERRSLIDYMVNLIKFN